jgi:hypothetical protein
VAKVVSHPKFEAPNLSDLATKIDQLLEADLRKSQLQIQISELAQTYRLTAAEVWKIYRTREQELEQEFSKKTQRPKLLGYSLPKKHRLNYPKFCPQG